MSVAEDIHAWFRGPLELLKKDQNAGLAAMFLTLPLLERLGRDKCGIGQSGDLDDRFHAEVVSLFPELGDTGCSRAFWQAYRNGLLHQVAFSRATRSGAVVPLAEISHRNEGPVILFDPERQVFSVDPFRFAEHVISSAEVRARDIETSSNWLGVYPLAGGSAHATGNAGETR